MNERGPSRLCKIRETILSAEAEPQCRSELPNYVSSQNVGMADLGHLGF
jgi:hypothetical protein